MRNAGIAALVALGVLLLALCPRGGEAHVPPPHATAKPGACRTQELGRQLTQAADAGVILDAEDGPLPRDPSKWVCPASLNGATQPEIDRWCATHPDRGLPLPERFRNPPPISQLERKNAFDRAFTDFLKSQLYRAKQGPGALGWIGDPFWRFTGPYVGDIGVGSNYSTHLPVHIYYSPEVIDWFCHDRKGELPEGAAIIKEMHLIDDKLGVVVEDDGCMTITNQSILPEAWTVMLRRGGESLDQWYWPVAQIEIPGGQPGQLVDPPIVDRSGFTRRRFVPDNPTAPDPDWYPTGYWPGNPSKVPNVITPLSGYGTFCNGCHASAERESTFASIDNVLGKSIRYKQFADEPGQVQPHERSFHLPPGFEDALRGLPPTGASDPYATPLATPPDAFLSFYDQLPEVPFSDTWMHRLPAQTYDHVFAAAGGPTSFLTSDQCVLCHDALNYLDSKSNMTVEEERDGATKTINLSPYGEWSASPMGLAGRDPIFFAQLEGETNSLTAHSRCIENTCLHCHGVMGQRQLAADTPREADPACEAFDGVAPPPGVPSGRPFRLDVVSQWPGSVPRRQQTYGALARDGISCTACHRISPDGLGTESGYTGNFVTDPPPQVNGPYEHVVTKPMQNAIGVTPGFGAQTLSSELCGSCHAILLPVFRNDGRQAGFKYEQTTYLEWLNSDFASGRPREQQCQGCHMPTHYQGKELAFKIANFESSDFPPTTHRLPDADIHATEREHYARHSLHGLNIFLNQMFQQFPLLLGFRQGTFFSRSDQDLPPLLLGEELMTDMARSQTASVEISRLARTRRGILASVTVTNHTGHDFPSGVGFRRAFLEVLVRDASGEVLWASGRTNGLGAILDGTSDEVLPSEQPVRFPGAPFQPHYQLVTEGNQVQIYQELVADSAGELTTSFLQRFRELKDNRIRPKGYDPRFYATFDSPFIRELARTPGRARFDRDYTDPRRTGSDRIEYWITLDPETLAQADNVQVTLYYQSIPPFYLQQRFRDAGRGPEERREIERLYYVTSHLDVDGHEAAQDKSVLQNWKLEIARETRLLPASE